MSDPSPSALRRIKIAITVAAVLALIARVVFPTIRVDAVSLGLIVVALLPWLSPLIKSIELPGGFKIELQDIKDAAEKVTSGEPAVAALAVAPPAPSFMAIADQDPRLAIVGLRIEIEKRLRALAEHAGIPRAGSLSRLTNDLERQGVLHPQSAAGLRDLIGLGNQAAHGALVAPEVAYSAVEFGPRVLHVLDAKLAELGVQPN